LGTKGGAGAGFPSDLLCVLDAPTGLFSGTRSALACPDHTRLKDVLEILEKLARWCVNAWRWAGKRHRILGGWIAASWLLFLTVGVAAGLLTSSRWRSEGAEAPPDVDATCAQDLLTCGVPQPYQPGRSSVSFVDRGSTIGVTFLNVSDDGRGNLGALILRFADPLPLGDYRAVELCGIPAQEVAVEIELKVLQARKGPAGEELTTIVEFLPSRRFPRSGETCQVFDVVYRGTIDGLVLAFDEPVGVAANFDLRSARLVPRKA